MDLAIERARLVEAEEAERAALVDSVAARADPHELVQITRWLTDDDANVRRAAIGVIEQSGFKPAIGALCAVARARGGAERLSALLALTTIADSGDREKIEPLLSLPVADDDERTALARLAIVVAHAQPAETATEFGLHSKDQAVRRAALVRVLKHAEDPVASLADSLLETKSDGVRMDLLGGLATLGGSALLAAAERVSSKADDDLLALLARQLVRKLADGDANLRARAALLLEKSRERVASVVTHAALDSAALALVPARAVRALAENLDALDDDGVSELAAAFAALDAEGQLSAVHTLVASLAASANKHPGRIARFAAALLDVEAKLPAGARAQLATLALQAASGADLPREQGALARLAARGAPAGSSLPTALALSLARSPAEDDRLALVELCLTLATEECAHQLIQLAQDDGVAGQSARDALGSFSSTEVRVLAHPGDRFEVLTAYADPHGEPLVADGRRLMDRAGRAWVLDESGPVLESATPSGGCACCFRARALEPARGNRDRPTCPVTGQRHLVDSDGPILEDSHPLGGCDACDSAQPLARDGDRIECRACHTRYRQEGDRLTAYKPPPPPLAIPARPARRAELKPPSEKAIEELPIDVQTAMRATVALYEGGSIRGAGICVAHDGEEIAVLTTREVATTVPSTCKTIVDEVAETRLIWGGRQGLDLALLGVELVRPEEVMAINLADGARSKIGDPLFAIGHERDRLWRPYKSVVATTQALRTSGLKVTFVHTPLELPPEASGGGLFHADGRLAGILSVFLRGGTNQTHFALAVESVIAALRRDRVKFGGARLV